MTLNEKELEEVALFLYKDGNDASEKQRRAVVKLLENLVIPKGGDKDYNIDDMKNWLLIYTKSL